MISNYSYAANDPCEDRITAETHTDGTTFVGAWDGNGGWGVAQYISERAAESFFQASDMLGSLAAMNSVFPKLDAELLARASKQPTHRGTLFCGSCCVAAHIDGSKLTVGNLGDSRAVLGVFDHEASASPTLGTVVLTRDHGADSKLEHARIAELHGDVDAVITRSSDGDCRVKGVAAVTRAMGLQHLKVMMPCLAYNKQVPPAHRINPRPGGPSKLKKGTKTPPYVLNEAEVSEWEVSADGFLILASDGVWDEMSCEEAVDVIGEYLSMSAVEKAAQLPLLPIKEGGELGAVLVEAALRKAHARITSMLEEEKDTTMEELMERPPGKKDTFPYGRSLLHDDITAMVVELPRDGVGQGDRKACVAGARRTEWALSPEEKDDAEEIVDNGSDSEDDYEDARDTRLRRHTVEQISAEEEAAILDALDAGGNNERLRRQTVDLDWDAGEEFVIDDLPPQSKSSGAAL